MKNPWTLILLLVFLPFFQSCQPPVSDAKVSLGFEIPFPAQHKDSVLDGRLLLMFSVQEEGEPRFQINDGPKSQQVFGMDVENWQPGTSLQWDSEVLGYPVADLGDLPAAKYQVQLLFHQYETFHLKTGHTVKLPMDRGEGQKWNRAPGNLYSQPVWLEIDPARNAKHTLELTEMIPPIEPAHDTPYINLVNIK
ncbi:MAG: hypothetical protein AAFR61_31300, partial [Bacteroidota bacterium]